MKKNYHARILYEMQLMDLAKEANESSFLGLTFSKVSNREILLMINGYLKKFGCIPFSEIDKISRLMN